jgi:hypothetical protein
VSPLLPVRSTAFLQLAILKSQRVPQAAYLRSLPRASKTAMALSFPASLLAVAALVLVGAVLRLFGLALPASSRPEMTAMWFLFVVAGYVQWFVIVPRLLRRWQGKYQREKS